LNSQGKNLGGGADTREKKRGVRKAKAVLRREKGGKKMKIKKVTEHRRASQPLEKNESDNSQFKPYSNKIRDLCGRSYGKKKKGLKIEKYNGS